MTTRRQLTARETMVVDYVSRGLTNRQIAEDLGVSLATVKRHLNNIMIKWDCGNRTQVAVQATLRRAGQPIRVAESIEQAPVVQLPDDGLVARVS